jgi:hypothetical protein
MGAMPLFWVSATDPPHPVRRKTVKGPAKINAPIIRIKLAFFIFSPPNISKDGQFILRRQTIPILCLWPRFLFCEYHSIPIAILQKFKKGVNCKFWLGLD